jgi:O-antigen/teichoic acid export membrane protein
MLLSVVISTAVFALAYPIAEQTFHEPSLAPLLQLICVFVPFLTLSEMLAGASRGFKRMEYPAIAQSIAQPIFRLILVVVLGVMGLNATHAIVIYGLSDATASVIMLYFLNREFSLRRPLRTARRDTRAILGFSLPLWLSQLLHQFRANAQTLILGSFNTVTSVGIFSVASQLNTFGGLFSSSINVASKPIIAELHDRGEREQMGGIYRATTKWSLMLQLPIFLIVVLFAEPILSIFGESFTDGAAALVVLAFADLVHVGTGMGGIILDMTGYTRLKLVNSILRFILYLGLDFLLIPGWGLMGAAVAVLLGEIAINLLVLLQVYFLFRLQPYDRSTLKPIAASLGAGASTLVLRLWLPAEASVFYMVIQIAVLLGVYVGVTLLLGLSEQERTVLVRFYRRVRSMIPGKRPG